MLAGLRQRLAHISDLGALTGGASSLTFAGALAGRRVVVKVAPPGLPPVAHRDVLRQARILRTLRGTAVPVPEILAEDHGDPPEVPPLFVMSFIDGAAAEPLFDAVDAGPTGVIAERFEHAAQLLAALHRLAPAELGLVDEPVVAPGAELDKWCRSLTTVPQELVPEWQRVAAALRSTTPAAGTPALVHGDFRLGNLLSVGGRITAVVDWEIWSVGDPRVDLGWFLINADPDTYGRVTPYRGRTPPVPELAAHYRRALGRSLPDLGWFQALACFKSTATWSLIVKHNRRRTTPDQELEKMAAALPRLLGRALDHLAC